MTPKQAEEIVRKACAEANPSIMDLKFGCEVLLTQDVGFNITIGNMPATFVRQRITEKEDIYLTMDGAIIPAIPTEILGRELQLSDILLAVENKTGRKSVKFLTKIPTTTIESLRVLECWNLLLPFSQQSDEVKLFLAGILKK